MSDRYIKSISSFQTTFACQPRNRVNCRWGQWTEWGSCTKTCGGGSQKSTRKIERPRKNGGSACEGDVTRSQPCNENCCPVDCQWGQWTDWEGCPVTCGGGTWTSTRVIEQDALCGGSNCTGNSDKDHLCNTNCCPVDCRWGQWTEWEACSVTCGGGTQMSTRGFEQEAECGGHKCIGDSTREEPCNTNGCPVGFYLGCYHITDEELKGTYQLNSMNSPYV